MLGFPEDQPAVDASIRQQVLDRKLKVLRCPPTRGQDSPFLPLAVAVLMPEEVVTFDLFVKVRPSERDAVTFLPYWKKGEVVHPSWLASLQKLGIDRLYIEKKSLDQVLAYLNNHLLLHSVVEEAPAAKLTLLREHLHLSLHRTFHSPNLGHHIHLARKTLEKFMGFLERLPNSWSLVGQILYHDYTLYTHSVNVGLLSLAAMVFLRHNRREGLLLGLAGLFHDLGMTRIPDDIIYKIDPLKETEREVLNKHPCYSFQILKKTPSFPLEALRLVLEHHENADGSGYPQGLTLAQQHPLTRLLRVVDSYDALTCPRPYRPALAPFAALKLLQGERGDNGPIFDPATLKKFVRFLAMAE